MQEKCTTVLTLIASTIFSDIPQDGMKCVSKGDEKEPTHTHANEPAV